MSDRDHFKLIPASEAPEGGETLLHALTGAGAEVRTDCGGEGICGKCLVRATPAENLSPPTPAELDILDRNEMNEGMRLACQAELRGPVEAFLPETTKDNKTALGKTGISGSFGVKQSVFRTVIPEAKRPDDGPGQPRDLAPWMLKRAGLTELKTSRNALLGISRIKRPEKELTLVHHHGLLASVREGAKPHGLGLAVDLGTTTIAAYLCDLGTGRVLATAGMANPQRRYGEDVISRIAHAVDGDEQTLELHQLAIKGVNDLIARITGQAGREADEIDAMCLVGNTTMQELFLGLSPRSLGAFPYLPVVKAAQTTTAGELGLALDAGAVVRVFPVASGFIGGDAVSAALAQPEPGPGESTLIVDLGTNGELVLISDHGAWAASAATGPAFEGASMSCGVRAVPGAVHKVDWDQSSHTPSCELIPGDEPVKALGLCGSGIIDAVAVLLNNGIIQPSGLLQTKSPLVKADENGVGREAVLLPAESCAGGEPLAISLKDVRQVQLAKAAIAAGISYLLEAAKVEKVTRTVLTGAFGARFNWRSAVAIGLLPPEANLGKVESAENSAGLGAVRGLLDEEVFYQATELAERIDVIELNRMPDFNTRYVQLTQFDQV